MNISSEIGVWIGAILTLCIWSFLWKDNFLYKIAESIFIGSSAGYIFSKLFHESFMAVLWNPLTEGTTFWGVISSPLSKGNAFLFIPFFLGLLMITRLFPGIGWMSRWPMAFIVGLGAGLNIYTFLQSSVIAQLHATMLPLIVYNGGIFDVSAFVQTFNNWVVVFGTLCALMYFFFSIEHKGIVSIGARFGIYVLMISFGASFGATVMARISLLIGRVRFLKEVWLGIV